MNKYTTLLQKYLKIIVFFSLVLGLFWGFGHLFQASTTLKSDLSQDVAQYKAEFFTAMQEHDLGKGRLAFEKLKTILPENDQFISETAPAYMADLYLKYAQTLHYDEKAHDLMLTQARQLSPQHPKLKAMQPLITEAQPPVAVATLEQQTLLPELTPAPEAVAAAQDPVSTGVPLSEQFPTLGDLDLGPEPDPIPVNEVQDGPPRVPYLDPPPLSPPVDYDHLAVASPEPTPTSLPPQSTDPCALSYYSKDHPLTPCIDPVGANRYGPALFVVGDTQGNPSIAFTQSGITYHEYEVFCEMAGQCYNENTEAETLIDLKDVQETLSDYNAYCQMTGSCTKIDPQTTKQRPPLTRGQIQRYALWLTKQTGYKYHHPTEQNITAIQIYFQKCVDAKTCQPGLIQTLGKLLAQPDTLLVRDVM